MRSSTIGETSPAVEITLASMMLSIYTLIDKEKPVYDFVGRLAEAHNLTSAGATYSKAVYTYTTRDLLESIKHYNNSSAYQEAHCKKRTSPMGGGWRWGMTRSGVSW